mmetsp:Transcript_24602/g.85568  ORF Transcript_24602/g.85568 Transcript_24602/m.85568 type:complete len:541 (+) Transcript_24602:746-2368(+)
MRASASRHRWCSSAAAAVAATLSASVGRASAAGRSDAGSAASGASQPGQASCLSVAARGAAYAASSSTAGMRDGSSASGRPRPPSSCMRDACGFARRTVALSAATAAGGASSQPQRATWCTQPALICSSSRGSHRECLASANRFFACRHATQPLTYTLAPARATARATAATSANPGATTAMRGFLAAAPATAAADARRRSSAAASRSRCMSPGRKAMPRDRGWCTTRQLCSSLDVAAICAAKRDLPPPGTPTTTVTGMASAAGASDTRTAALMRRVASANRQRSMTPRHAHCCCHDDSTPSRYAACSSFGRSTARPALSAAAVAASAASASSPSCSAMALANATSFCHPGNAASTACCTLCRCDAAGSSSASQPHWACSASSVDSDGTAAAASRRSRMTSTSSADGKGSSAPRRSPGPKPSSAHCARWASRSAPPGSRKPVCATARAAGTTSTASKWRDADSGSGEPPAGVNTRPVSKTRSEPVATRCTEPPTSRRAPLSVAERRSPRPSTPLRTVWLLMPRSMARTLASSTPPTTNDDM